MDLAGSSGASGSDSCPLAGSVVLALIQTTDVAGPYAICFPSLGVTIAADTCQLNVFALGSSGLSYEGQPCPSGPLSGGVVNAAADLPAALKRALETPSFGPSALAGVQAAGAGGIRVLLGGLQALTYSVDMVSD